MWCSNCGEGAAAVQALPVQVTTARDCPCLSRLWRTGARGDTPQANVRPTSPNVSNSNAGDTPRVFWFARRPSEVARVFVLSSKSEYCAALRACRALLKRARAHCWPVGRAVWKTSTIFSYCPETGRSLNSRSDCGEITVVWCQELEGWIGSIRFNSLGLIAWQRCYFRLVWLRPWDTEEFDLGRREWNLVSKWEESRRKANQIILNHNIEFECLDKLTDAQLSFIETEQT